MKKFCILLLISHCLAGCYTMDSNRVGIGWTGQGWYHEGKTQQEMWQDWNQCKAQAAMHLDILQSIQIEMYCMQGKGYVYR